MFPKRQKQSKEHTEDRSEQRQTTPLPKNKKCKSNILKIKLRLRGFLDFTWTTITSLHLKHGQNSLPICLCLEETGHRNGLSDQIRRLRAKYTKQGKFVVFSETCHWLLGGSSDRCSLYLGAAFWWTASSGHPRSVLHLISILK